MGDDGNDGDGGGNDDDDNGIDDDDGRDARFCVSMGAVLSFFAISINPCMWLGITIWLCYITNGKCSGISNQYLSAISPISDKFIFSSTISLKK